MIPLSIPELAGNEWKYIKECLDTNWVSSVGAYVDRFEQHFAEFVGAKYAVATMNGTAALHISLMMAGVERGDYVIVPNITFIASVNSIKYAGASPILVDIKDDTWQMDLDLLEGFLEKNTRIENGNCIHIADGKRIKAIMPVHVLGGMCDMTRLKEIADRFYLPIVEDSTEALGSYCQDRHAGTFGELGCFSFNGNKIITTGGGGMIVTNDPELAKRAKHLTTQAKSDPFEYVHDEIGYNYRLVNVLAAMGVAQLEQLGGFLERKKEIANTYKQSLDGCADIRFQAFDPEVQSNNWLFTIRTRHQPALLAALNDNGIQSRPFWVPMNQLEMFKQDLYIHEADVSDVVYQECLSVPCSSGLTEAQLQTTIQQIESTIGQLIKTSLPNS